MSVISTSQAESIKKSMDNIGAKDVYIQIFTRANGPKRFTQYGPGDEFERRCR